MKRALVAVVAVLALAGVPATVGPVDIPDTPKQTQVEKADAHKTFCHHGSVSWSVWSYGQEIRYIELWKYGYQSLGVHMHVYWTTYNQGKFLHEHHRACGGTHS